MSTYSQFLGNGAYKGSSDSEEELLSSYSGRSGTGQSTSSVRQRRTTICLIVMTVLAVLLVAGLAVLAVLHAQLLTTNKDLQRQLDALQSSTTTTSTSTATTTTTTTTPTGSVAAAWQFVGPNISTSGIGSINSIAADADFSTVYVGASNGGVWSTRVPQPSGSLPADDIDDWSQQTRWQALTDHNTCLSAAAVSVSPADSSFVAYACGKVSSYLFYSGPLAGVFYSYDAGSTWQTSQIDARFELSDFTSLVVLDGQGAAGTGRLVAGAKARRVPVADSGFVWAFDYGQGGIFTSSNSGRTFEACTDPLVYNVPILDVRGSPAVRSDVYAVTAAGRLLYSHDYGQHWTDISAGVDYAAIGPVVNGRVAVHASADTDSVVYLLLCDNSTGGFLAWRPVDGGDWQQRPIPDDVALYGGVFFFGLSADPSRAELAYIVGAVSAAYVADTSLAASPDGMYRSLTNSSEPHADMRAILYTANSNDVMYVGCDGGIYSLENPAADAADGDQAYAWQAHNGNLAITEMDSIAYDARSKSFASGAQDNGVWLSVQASIDAGYSPGNFYTFDVGDGETVAFNSRVDPAVLYASGQNLGGFFAYRVGDPPEQMHAIELPDAIFNDSPFYTDIQINAVKPSLIMSCSATLPLCWQFDFGDDPLNTHPVVTTLVELHPDQAPQTPFTNYFYGGRRNGADNPDVVFAIAGNSFVYGTDPLSRLTFQLPANQQWYLAKDSMQLRNPKYRLAVNPADYYELVTCTMSSRVHRSTNFGQSWQDITGNLAIVTGAISDPLAWGVAVVPFAADDAMSAVLVGTPAGIYATFSDAVGQWHSLSAGSALPNVLISNLLYDADADILIANTMGRGWWQLPNALQTVLAVYNARSL